MKLGWFEKSLKIAHKIKISEKLPIASTVNDMTIEVILEVPISNLECGVK